MRIWDKDQMVENAMNEKYYKIAKVLVIIVLVTIVSLFITLYLSDMMGSAPYGSLIENIWLMADWINFVLLYFTLLACLPLSIIAAVLFKRSNADTKKRFKAWWDLAVVDIAVSASVVFYMVMGLIFHD